MSAEVTVLPSTNASENKQLESDADEHRIKESTQDKKGKTQVSDMARISSGTDEESKSPVKIKQKRIVHNEVERRRKVKINNHIFTLAKLLPNKGGKKWSKNEVLTKAIEYIQEIKENHEKLLIGKMNEVQVNEFKTMKGRIEELEKQNSQFMKLLEIAGFPSGATSGLRLQCDKAIKKLDPSTIVMDDDGMITVVSPSSQPDNVGSNGKRRGKVDSQSSPKKKTNGTKAFDANAINNNVTVEAITSLSNCLSSTSTVVKNSECVSTSNGQQVNVSKSSATVHLSSSPSISHTNVISTKEAFNGNITCGVTAVTHSLQGGPIMSTSQNSPQLQLQPTTTVVSQIPMLNFGGTVNLMQGAQMQPVLTINEQGIQVIQMMTTPNGQVMVNPNTSSTQNLFLTNSSATGTPALSHPGNGVQIDCSSGPAPTLISADSTGIPVLQQTVCGGSLIAQGTQYMSNLTTNPQVHLMTNSPPVISATPNCNVMLGGSVQGAPHANTVLTLNSNSSSNKLPSALMLPNGQIIPVVREPQQLPLIYQNQTQINGSLIMSANPSQNSSCTVFNTNAVNVSNANAFTDMITYPKTLTPTTVSSSLDTPSQHDSGSTKLALVNCTTSANTLNSQSPAIVQFKNCNDNVSGEKSTTITSVTSTTTVNCSNLQRGNQKEVKKPGTLNAVNSAKKNGKRSTTNASQRSIKPKPSANANKSASKLNQLTKSPISTDKNDQLQSSFSKSAKGTCSTSPVSTAASVTSTSSLSTTVATFIASNATSPISTNSTSTALLPLPTVEENFGLVNKDKVNNDHNIATLSAKASSSKVNMTDILAQATESIFANSISDISNSPNPTYFGNGDNVDFLNTISESTKNVSLPSTTFTNALSTCTTMTSSSDPLEMGTKSCSMVMDTISNHHPISLKSGGRGIGCRNTAADILGDLVGEVYRSANTPNSLISTCTPSSFNDHNQQQSHCSVGGGGSALNSRLTLSDVMKTKRSNSEDDILSVKRNKLNSKVSSEDLTMPSTTVTSTSVNFLSVSQLASSASVSSSNTITSETSTCTVTFSNPITTNAIPFSIDTANSNENSPICSISPLLNSPSKSNDIFALSTTISTEDQTFANTAIVNNNLNDENANVSNGSGANISNSSIANTPSTSTLSFPGLSNTFNSNNPLSSSSPTVSTFALPDLSGANPTGAPDIQNNYKAFSYQPNQSNRTNFNGVINFQANDSIGFSLTGPLASLQECFMDKTIKSSNFDYGSRSRQNSTSRTHLLPISTSGNLIGTSSPAQYSSDSGVQAAQFNRLQSYSSIPLSHPVSPRLNPTVPSPVNTDMNQTNDISCGVNKNKSTSPRQPNISGSSENNLIGQQLNLTSIINSGCLQRAGSIHHLPNLSSNNHQDVSPTSDQSGGACSQHRHPHIFSNNNSRIHPFSRQSPQMCPSSSPSPKSAVDHHGHSPINHRGSSSSNSSTNTNVSPKLSPVGHGLTNNQVSNVRSSHSATSAGNHTSPATFIPQRPPNLDPPLITSFSTESITMHNNSTNNMRREPMFPPGQKQLTHPPLGMLPSSTSGVSMRAAISYSAESLIQSQDNSSNNRPNCARENFNTSSSNTILRQSTSMHNAGPMTSPHTLPFMHSSHLNRTNEDNQQVGFPYFPFQQTTDQASHLIQLKPNHQVHSNLTAANKNHHHQNTQPQPNFSFSLMPPGSHQSSSDSQQNSMQEQQSQQQQQQQRHTNYLSVGNYGQVPPPMPGLDTMSHKDIQVPRPPMAFPCHPMPPFPSSQTAVNQGVPNIRHRHSASFFTTPPNRDNTIGSASFHDSYTAGQSSLTPLTTNSVMGNNLVPLPIQGTDKGSGYKSRAQNKQENGGKLSKSKQSQNLKKKNQHYQIEEVNLSNSIFETGRSTTPYFPIPNLSPPRNEGPTYIPNPNPLFNKTRAAKNNTSSGVSNHSKTGDSYNTLFHARAQTGFNLNFQTPSFSMNHLHGSTANNDGNGGGAVNQIGTSHVNPAPPPPPLVSSSSSHVPNFNLSNIFPDINAGNESLNISPIKFHSNHMLPPPPTPGASQSMDGHGLQHSQSGTLYHANRTHHHPPPPPPPPSVIHNGMTINSILSHSPHTFDGRAPVGINNSMTPWTWTSNIQ